MAPSRRLCRLAALVAGLSAAAALRGGVPSIRRGGGSLSMRHSVCLGLAPRHVLVADFAAVSNDGLADLATAASTPRIAALLDADEIDLDELEELWGPEQFRDENGFVAFCRAVDDVFEKDEPACRAEIARRSWLASNSREYRRQSDAMKPIENGRASPRRIGGGSRRRRGCHADIPRGGRGAAAAAAWTFRGRVAASPLRELGSRRYEEVLLVDEAIATTVGERIRRGEVVLTVPGAASPGDCDALYEAVTQSYEAAKAFHGRPATNGRGRFAVADGEAFGPDVVGRCEAVLLNALDALDAHAPDVYDRLFAPGDDWKARQPTTGPPRADAAPDVYPRPSRNLVRWSWLCHVPREDVASSPATRKSSNTVFVSPSSAAARPRLVATASPRIVSTEYPSRGRGRAATRLHRISTSQPRRRRVSSPRNLCDPSRRRLDPPRLVAPETRGRSRRRLEEHGPEVRSAPAGISATRSRA